MWFVYILKCSDQSFYTGVTNDLEKRLECHNAGKGAKYTRGRGPVKIVYTEKKKSRSTALKRELEIKSWPRTRKMSLILDNSV